METTVSSATRTVTIGGNQPTVIIGERINPSGKRRLAEALLAGDMTLVRDEAVAQVAAGADIIDVNVAADGVDGVRTLPLTVQAVAESIEPGEGEAPTPVLLCYGKVQASFKRTRSGFGRFLTGR